MTQKPTLYIKRHCPWCINALAFFSKKGFALNIKDVEQDTDALQRMRDISGQHLTPTFEYGDFVVADFSVEEFETALQQNPENKKALEL